jgi:hypothetical protein
MIYAVLILVLLEEIRSCDLANSIRYIFKMDHEWLYLIHAESSPKRETIDLRNH